MKPSALEAFKHWKLKILLRNASLTGSSWKGKSLNQGTMLKRSGT